MLQHFDAGDQIKIPSDGISNGTYGTVIFNVAPDFGYCIFRNINAFAIDAPIPERLDQETHGTSGIQNTTRVQGADDLVSYNREKVQPVGRSFVWATAACGVIFRAVLFEHFLVRQRISILLGTS